VPPRIPVSTPIDRPGTTVPACCRSAEGGRGSCGCHTDLVVNDSTGRGRAVREPRSTAEWWSFSISLAVLAVIVALLVVQAVEGGSPAEPVASVSSVTAAAGSFHVAVEVVNEGGRAAAEVQVSATLVVDGQEATGDQVVDFLGADERASLMFVFTDDPDAGELTVDVTSFAVP
jgi:uncharacterized protein (TIGR02588 family)